MNLAKFSKSERHKFSNPKTVIADTGASLNVSGCAEGFVNKRIASNGMSVMMGNNHAHSPDIIGDVNVTQFAKDGSQGKNLLWKDVHVSKHVEFLSVIKYMNDGWKLTGTKTKMTLTKGDIVLKFDTLIKETCCIVPTSSGMLQRMQVLLPKRRIGKPSRLWSKKSPSSSRKHIVRWDTWEKSRLEPLQRL